MAPDIVEAESILRQSAKSNLKRFVLLSSAQIYGASPHNQGLIPESRLPDIKRYMARGALAVEAKPPNDEGGLSRGHITFIDNSVDQTTGTIRVKATFTNEDHRLWPGQFVNVIVALTKDPTAVVVPTAAVQVGQQGQYAYVVKTDKSVEYRPVVVERTAGLETVIKSGLKPAETVVTDGQLRIVAGSRVSIKGEESPQVTP